LGDTSDTKNSIKISSGTTGTTGTKKKGRK